MLASMLGEWRDEMRWPPATGLITERDAVAALRSGLAEKQKHTPAHSRRGLSIVGAAAAGVLAIGGFGAVVAGAGPGDALYGLRTMLFGAPKQVRDDQVALAAQTQLNQVQDLIAKGDWQQAQDKLVAVSTQVESVGDEEQKQQLLDQWNELSAKVVQKDPEATVPPGITYTVPPSATELVPAVVTPSEGPEVPPTSVPDLPPITISTTPSESGATTTPSEGSTTAPTSPSQPSTTTTVPTTTQAPTTTSVGTHHVIGPAHLHDDRRHHDRGHHPDERHRDDHDRGADDDHHHGHHRGRRAVGGLAPPRFRRRPRRMPTPAAPVPTPAAPVPTAVATVPTAAATVPTAAATVPSPVVQAPKTPPQIVITTTMVPGAATRRRELSQRYPS